MSPRERAGADEAPDSPAPNVLLFRSSSSVGGRLARETATRKRRVRVADGDLAGAGAAIYRAYLLLQPSPLALASSRMVQIPNLSMPALFKARFPRTRET